MARFVKLTRMRENDKLMSQLGKSASDEPPKFQLRRPFTDIATKALDALNDRILATAHDLALHRSPKDPSTLTLHRKDYNLAAKLVIQAAYQ